MREEAAASGGTIVLQRALIVGAGYCLAKILEEAIDFVEEILGSNDFDIADYNSQESDENEETNNDQDETDDETESSRRSNPLEGEPGTDSKTYDDDGELKQTRRYGEDGYPEYDIDYDHDHGQGTPHRHDWSRPDGGGDPTHENREPGKPVQNDSSSQDSMNGSEGEATDGNSIICTELYEQGLMDPYIYKADSEFGRYLLEKQPHVIIGYHFLAQPIVGLMRKSKAFTDAVNIFAKPWSYEMAYRVGKIEKGNLFGKAIMTIGIPLCGLIGNIILWLIDLRISIFFGIIVFVILYRIKNYIMRLKIKSQKHSVGNFFIYNELKAPNNKSAKCNNL